MPWDCARCVHGDATVVSFLAVEFSHERVWFHSAGPNQSTGWYVVTGVEADLRFRCALNFCFQHHFNAALFEFLLGVSCEAGVNFRKQPVTGFRDDGGDFVRL
jgi:hypothetical protein